MGNTPSYYNVGKGFAEPLSYTTPINNKYTSPSRTTGPSSYWNNPNHITISPTKYAPEPQFYNVYDNYPSGNYTPLPSLPPPNPMAGTYSNDFNVGNLLNNIDRVLGQPQAMNTMTSTFDRASSFTPNFKTYHSPVRDTYVSPSRVHFENQRQHYSPARQNYSPVRQNYSPARHYPQAQEQSFMPRREYESPRRDYYHSQREEYHHSPIRAVHQSPPREHSPY